MPVHELIGELQKLPPDLPVYVAADLYDDYVPLERVWPKEHTDDDFVVLTGTGDE